MKGADAPGILVTGVGLEPSDRVGEEDDWVEVKFFVVVLGNRLVLDLGFLVPEIDGDRVCCVEEGAVVWDDGGPLPEYNVAGSHRPCLSLSAACECVLTASHGVE